MSGDPLIGQLIFQVILILINAFFAMTEMAVIGINDNKLNHMAEEGHKQAKALNELLIDPARFLSTIQVGVTLVGFLGSAFAANNFARRITELIKNVNPNISNLDAINTLSIIIVTIILSYFTLVFGELVPKRIAQKNSEKIALGVTSIVSFISVLFRPMVWILTRSTNAVLRLFRINPKDESEDITEEEIRMMVDIGEEKGTIDSSEREMIDNVFEFSDTTAEDVMTHRTDVTALWVKDSVEDIEAAIKDTGLSRFPVYDEDIDDIIGILHLRDYFLNKLSENSKPLEEILHPAYFVPLSVRADVLFRNMQIKKIHMAIVVDEYGGTNGLVTMEDLLEEIVGNIYDEYDPLEHEIEKVDEDTYRIEGSVDLEDVEDLFNISLPTEEFGTLGGLIFSQLPSIPDDGSQPELNVCGLNVKVEKIEDRRIETALVRRVPVEQNDQSE